MSHFLCSDLQSDLLVSTTCQHKALVNPNEAKK